MSNMDSGRLGPHQHKEQIEAIIREAMGQAVQSAKQAPTAIQGAATGFARCRDGFGQLAAILKAIESQSGQTSDLRGLTGAGLHIARDLEDLADRWSKEAETGA